MALTIREEPSNALSLPTWAIHISSVAEWCVRRRLNSAGCPSLGSDHNASLQGDGDGADVDFCRGFEETVLEGHELGYGACSCLQLCKTSRGTDESRTLAPMDIEHVIVGFTDSLVRSYLP
jgi:Protein of unknown function (DUF2499)